jgi:hypothetical protein
MSKKTSRDNKQETREDRFNPVELEDAMINYSREPFRKALMDYLQGNPNVDEIKAFSKRYPDRHAQSCAIFARLAGYSEKVQIDIEKNIHLWIKNASDMELIQKNNELEKELAEMKARSIDITPTEPIKPQPKSIDVTPRSSMPVRETDQMTIAQVQGKKSSNK